MLRRPEPTKERFERTNLGITAIQIIHSTRFTFLLLLRIQCCVWRNYVVTCDKNFNSDRNLDLTKIWFSDLHYILQYNFWIGF